MSPARPARLLAPLGMLLVVPPASTAWTSTAWTSTAWTSTAWSVTACTAVWASTAWTRTRTSGLRLGPCTA